MPHDSGLTAQQRIGVILETETAVMLIEEGLVALAREIKNPHRLNLATRLIRAGTSPANLLCRTFRSDCTKRRWIWRVLTNEATRARRLLLHRTRGFRAGRTRIRDFDR